MELRHLRYFVVVAEEQNVTRAAARLHVSQPPLSRQIRDLEDELGVSLFKRTAKSLSLTEPGRLFLAEARAVLLRVDQAVQVVRMAAAGNRGQLKVGYAPSLTVRFLARGLAMFEQEYPGVKVSLYDLSSEECITRLSAGKLDLALTVPPMGRTKKAVTFEKLAQYSICCGVPSTHPLAKKRGISLNQLNQERLITYTREDYPEYHEWLAGLFEPLRVRPLAMEEYDSVTGVMAAVESGRGVAIVSSSLSSLAGPKLKLLPLIPAPPAFNVGAVFASELPDLARQFVGVMKRAAAETGNEKG